MTAIIRVKRRLEDDPVEALLLSFKKRRTDEDEEKSEFTLLQFTGTVDDKNDEETIPKALNTLKTKSEFAGLFKKGSTDFIGKRRDESRHQSKENRFKILSCNRRIIPVDAEGGFGSNITIVDVHNEIEDEPEASACAEPKYVYDLYSKNLGDEGDFFDGYYEGLVSVQPYVTELEYRGSEDSEKIDPYDEDSNEESNWRNDYPDSDHSINEDDMRLAASLRGMGLDDGYDLSSDDSDHQKSDLYKILEKHRKNNGLIEKERYFQEDADSESDCL